MNGDYDDAENQEEFKIPTVMPNRVPVPVNHGIQFNKPPLQLPKPRANDNMADRYSPIEW